MSEVIMSFTIPSDSEGYVTFECPFCKSEFKLLANECQNSDVTLSELFCPYCGLTNEFCQFYTQEALDYAKTMAENYFIDQVNKKIGKMAKSMNKSKFLKMDFKPLKKGTLSELKGLDTAEEAFQCKLCERHEKVVFCVGVSKIFCAYCGGDL